MHPSLAIERAAARLHHRCRCAKKDTVEILAKLQGCFPFAKNEDEGNVQKLLGPINQSIMARAIAAVEAGDPETLGKLMTEAQVRRSACSFACTQEPSVALHRYPHALPANAACRRTSTNTRARSALRN